MAQPSAPPMQDKNAPFSHQYQPVNTSPYTQGYPEPPPPYTAQAPGTAPGPAPAPQVHAPYPQQAAVPLMAAPPVQPPMQQIVQPPVQQIVVPPPQQVVVPPAQAAQVIVVGGTVNLPPGTCTVCRVRSTILLRFGMCSECIWKIGMFCDCMWKVGISSECMWDI